MPRNAAELAHRLAREAEAVCRHYLSNGRRVGNYWQVGDVRNASGRSMFVRLKGVDSSGRQAGKWTDAATGEHGDLLDVIRESCGLVDFHDVTEEARRFLSLPRPAPDSDIDRVRLRHRPAHRNRHGVCSACRSRLRVRLWRLTCEDAASLTCMASTSLRFHPRCYYRPDADAPTEIWPAMIAAVTDLQGHITGAHRTWLDPSGRDKAPVDTPRRAMGHLLGHAVRFGPASDVMAAGEGIETMLSLRCVMPTMPMVAALSAAHLGAILFPATLRRLYIVRDDDRGGRWRGGRPVRPGAVGRDRGDGAVAAVRRFQRGSAELRHQRAACSVAHPAHA